MEIEKQNFEYNIIPNINLLREYYNNNISRLAIINFLPFFCNDFNELKNVLANFNQFTQEDINNFIIPFIEIMENESVFFFDYWDNLHNNNETLRYAMEEFIKAEINKYSCVFDYYNKSASVFPSYSITRNGRGFNGMDNYFSASIPFPANDSNFYNAFFILLHEYTHQFTDNLLNRNINFDDGSHNLSERVVVLTDYYLIKIIDESLIPAYIKLFSNGNSVNEEDFLELYKIDEILEKEIKDLINDIIK
jgi:hypothetical protein